MKKGDIYSYHSALRDDKVYIYGEMEDEAGLKWVRGVGKSGELYNLDPNYFLKNATYIDHDELKASIIFITYGLQEMREEL